MHAKVAMILQNIETLAARAACIEVNDKLVDDALQSRQVPSAAAHPLQFLDRDSVLPQIVTVGRTQLPHFCLWGLPIRLVQRTKPALHSVGIISPWIQPEHNRGSCVDESTRGNDLVSSPRRERASERASIASAQQADTTWESDQSCGEVDDAFWETVMGAGGKPSFGCFGAIGAELNP